MRLIDADAFKDWLLSHFAESQDTLVLAFQGFIAEQPTAYDADMVVEELEENASRYTKKYVTPYGNNGYRDTKAISIRKAIKIVKQGGICGGCIEVGGCPVRDDCPNEPNVCEWKKRAKTYDWEPSCEPNSTYNVAGVGWFRYCPYCGKKIKVVD